MVVLGTGTVTFTDIKNAFGGAATNINLGRYYKGGSFVTNGNEPAIPSSGNPLSVSILRGRSANLTYTAPQINITSSYYTPYYYDDTTYFSGNRYITFRFTDGAPYSTITSTKVYFNVDATTVSGTYYLFAVYRQYDKVNPILVWRPSEMKSTGSKTVTFNYFVSWIEIILDNSVGSITISNIQATYTGDIAAQYSYS